MVVPFEIAFSSTQNRSRFSTRDHCAPRRAIPPPRPRPIAPIWPRPRHRQTPKLPQLYPRALVRLVGPPQRLRALTSGRLRDYSRAFTLLELLVVMAVISLLMVVIAPAFTGINSAGDVASAAYTIKGVLEQARTYAMANDTYTWVGFFEEDAGTSIPAILGNGRLVISAVASTDGTNLYGSGTGTIDPTKLIQIGKLAKISNVHLPLFQVGSGTGDAFDTRPAVQNDPTGGYNYSRFGELNNPTPNTAPYTTPYNFQYPVGNPAPAAQYTFKKILQFDSRGEARVNGDTYDVRRVVEIGLIPTHGNTVPSAVSGAGTSTATYNGNAVALQIVGFGADIKVYRR